MPSRPSGCSSAHFSHLPPAGPFCPGSLKHDPHWNCLTPCFGHTTHHHCPSLTLRLLSKSHPTFKDSLKSIFSRKLCLSLSRGCPCKLVPWHILRLSYSHLWTGHPPLETASSSRAATVPQHLALFLEPRLATILRVTSVGDLQALQLCDLAS